MSTSPQTRFCEFDKEKILDAIKQTKLYMINHVNFSRKCMPSDKRLRLSHPYTRPNIGSDSDTEDYDDVDSDEEMNDDLLCPEDFDENGKVLSQQERNTKCLKRNVENFCKIISRMPVVDGNFRVNQKANRSKLVSPCVCPFHDQFKCLMEDLIPEKYRKGEVF